MILHTRNTPRKHDLVADLYLRSERPQQGRQRALSSRASRFLKEYVVARSSVVFMYIRCVVCEYMYIYMLTTYHSILIWSCRPLWKESKRTSSTYIVTYYYVGMFCEPRITMMMSRMRMVSVCENVCVCNEEVDGISHTFNASDRRVSCLARAQWSSAFRRFGVCGLSVRVAWINFSDKNDSRLLGRWRFAAGHIAQLLKHIFNRHTHTFLCVVHIRTIRVCMLLY